MPGKKTALSTASLAKLAVLAVVVGGLGRIAWTAVSPDDGSIGGTDAGMSQPTVADVVVPAKFSSLAADGRVLYERSCAACHGQNAAGTDKGPPLVHDLYNTGHHSDDAFVLAARLGVRAHHWRYGNMPPRPEVTEPQARAIARYVRELQAANGIATRPHTM